MNKQELELARKVLACNPKITVAGMAKFQKLYRLTIKNSEGGF